jgi:hypothetical protein
LQPAPPVIRIGGPTVSDGMASGGRDAGAVTRAPFVLTHRAKYAVLLQATGARALLGLVVARAVNAFR